MPRALGVALARELKARPEIAGMICENLADCGDARGIEEELNVLRQHVRPEPIDADTETGARPAAKPVGPSETKTTFHLQTGAGRVKCTANVGQLEIKLDRDFSSVDRGRLERAVMKLNDGLS